MENKIKVLFAGFEGEPFIKTGGLGDVIGSLPAALNQAGCEVRVILPKLAVIPEKYTNQMRYITAYGVPLGWRRQHCGLFALEHNGVTFYFLDNEYYFKRDSVYGYNDDGERIAFFAKAVCESIQHIEQAEGFAPDVLHCHDWHTALSPVFLREHYNHLDLYKRIKTVFTIHNLKFQGQFSADMLYDVLGLDGTPAESQLRQWNQINMMQAAVLYSDFVTTVSPTYAEEICTAEYGEGLSGLFNSIRYKLKGILNGIDVDKYNPATDPAVAIPFTGANLDQKVKSKLALQKELGLEVNPDVPLLSIVSRLTDQKGLQLVDLVMPGLMDRSLQLVVLGLGDGRYEDMFTYYGRIHPSRVAPLITFNDTLARKIYAGSDLFIMPSLFEPCGLSQMIAMRYGTLPLVRKTGGLADSVRYLHDHGENATGFGFEAFTANALWDTIDTALYVYENGRSLWNKLAYNAISEDFSWHSSAQSYRSLYEQIL